MITLRYDFHIEAYCINMLTIRAKTAYDCYMVASSMSLQVSLVTTTGILCVYISPLIMLMSIVCITSGYKITTATVSNLLI